MPKLDHYLTINRAAAFLGVSPNTLRNWGASGKITVHRNPMNKYRLFKIKDLERLLDDVDKSGEACSKQRLRWRTK